VLLFQQVELEFHFEELPLNEFMHWKLDIVFVVQTAIISQSEQRNFA
jgi:hypothetical protein